MLHFLNHKYKIIKTKKKHIWFTLAGFVFFFAVINIISYTNLFAVKYDSADAEAEAVVNNKKDTKIIPPPVVLDIVAYNKKLIAVANNDIPIAKPPIIETNEPTALTNLPKTTTTPAPIPPPNPWPVKTVEPIAGALLPFNRIVAYYGNFYSTKMGVLGEYATDIMLQKLKSEVESWKAADPLTPVIPAIDYIAITAQGSPGADGKYRFRMPSEQIDHAVELAKQINGIVFLDLQVGLSNVQIEVPLLEKYLKMPEVHLALDPEFSMKTGAKPGTVIGTLDATDINFAANYLAGLVKENNLPPKILVIHRFTVPMLTHYKQITPLPEVQIVMDMDGWGFGAKKINTYKQVVYNEPIQFTGFKLFYKNDLRAPSTRMLTPAEILELKPQPMYIQYQ